LYDQYWLAVEVSGSRSEVVCGYMCLCMCSRYYAYG